MKPIFQFLVLTLLAGGVTARTSGEVPTQEVTVEANGLGAILGGDQAAARDRAIKDAQRNAVEQAVGTMISAETKVENFQLISDRILTESAGYLQRYDVADERQVDPQTYEVTIRALVKIGNLKNDLSAVGLCYEFVGRPRLMVLIGETTGLNTAETTIIEAFFKVQRKFLIIDERTARRNLDQSQARAAFDGDNAAAAAIARAATADILIIGEVVAKAVNLPMLGSMKSGQANISVRVVRVDNGTIITTKDDHAAVPHIDETTAQTLAIKKASLQLAGALMQPILEGWCMARTSGTIVQLVIRNVGDYGQLLDFETALQNSVRGVRTMNQRSFDGGVAIYDLEIDTDVKDLAREMTLKEGGTLTIKVLSVSQSKLEIKLEAKKGQ